MEVVCLPVLVVVVVVVVVGSSRPRSREGFLVSSKQGWVVGCLARLRDLVQEEACSVNSNSKHLFSSLEAWAWELVALELVAWELEALELVAWELEALELVSWEPEALELEAWELEALELVALVILVVAWGPVA